MLGFLVVLNDVGVLVEPEDARLGNNGELLRVGEVSVVLLERGAIINLAARIEVMFVLGDELPAREAPLLLQSHAFLAFGECEGKRIGWECRGWRPLTHLE